MKNLKIEFPPQNVNLPSRNPDSVQNRYPQPLKRSVSPVKSRMTTQMKQAKKLLDHSFLLKNSRSLLIAQEAKSGKTTNLTLVSKLLIKTLGKEENKLLKDLPSTQPIKLSKNSKTHIGKNPYKSI